MRSNERKYWEVGWKFSSGGGVGTPALQDVVVWEEKNWKTPTRIFLLAGVRGKSFPRCNKDLPSGDNAAA